MPINWVTKRKREKPIYFMLKASRERAMCNHADPPTRLHRHHWIVFANPCSKDVRRPLELGLGTIMDNIELGTSAGRLGFHVIGNFAPNCASVAPITSRRLRPGPL